MDTWLEAANQNVKIQALSKLKLKIGFVRMKSWSTKFAEPKIPSAVVGKVNFGQIFLPMKTT